MKQRRSREICLFSCLLAVTLLGACGADGGEKEPKEDLIVVGFSEVGAESDWRVANTESIRSTFTEENGYELLFDDAKQKQENQIAAVRNFILQEVDYIVLDPVVEEGWDEVLQEAKDAGIPLIVVDRRVDVKDDSLFTAWVGSDMKKEGDTAIEWLEGYLKEQGREEEALSIVHIQGTLGSSAQIGRTGGLEAGLAAHPNWKLAQRIDGEFTQAKTYEALLAYLETDKDIDVVYCENDNSAFGAIQALEASGIRYGAEGGVIVISFDASSAGLTACLDGKINVDVECDPMNGPRVEAIIQLLEEGETPEKECYIEETYFTKENLSEELIASRGY